MSYRQTISQSDKKVTIPNKGVDTTRMTVTVYESESDTIGTVFEQRNNIVGVERDDPVYFIQEVENELYQIYFGDGIIGKGVVPGNIVKIDYVKTAGAAANNARIFSLTGTIPYVNRIKNVITINNSYGGADIEDIESIRLRSPANFQKQNRSVLAIDFEDSVKDIYPNAKGATAWGGEEHIPPRYGSTFVSIIPGNGYIMTDTVRKNIQSKLKENYTMLGMTPVVVNPSYMYVIPKTIVSYNSSKSNPGIENLRSNVKNTIISYNNNNLSGFRKSLRFSKLSTNIDNSDTSIVSNETDITIYIEIISLAEMRAAGNVIFNLNIEKGSFETNEFSYANYESFSLKESDDSIIVGYDNIQDKIVMNNLGTVDHENGIVNINFNRFRTEDIKLNSNERIKCFAVPIHGDITPVRNQVITIKQSDIEVKIKDTVTNNVL